MSSKINPSNDVNGFESIDGSNSNFEEIRSKFNNGFPNSHLKGKNVNRSIGKGSTVSQSKSGDSISSQDRSPVSLNISRVPETGHDNIALDNPHADEPVSPKGIELVNSISDENLHNSVISPASINNAASYGEQSPMLAKETPSKLTYSKQNGDKDEEEIQFIDLQSPSKDYQDPIYIECEGEGMVRQVFHSSPNSNASSSPDKRNVSRSSSTSSKTKSNSNPNHLSVQTDFTSKNVGTGKARSKSSSGEGDELFPRRDTFSNMQTSSLDEDDENDAAALLLAQDRANKRALIEKLNQERDFFSSLELSSMGAIVPKDSMSCLSELADDDSNNSGKSSDSTNSKQGGSGKPNRGILKKTPTLRKAGNGGLMSPYWMKKLRRAIVFCVIMFLLGTGTVMIASKFIPKKQIEQDFSTFFTHVMKQIDSQPIAQQHFEVLSIITNEIDTFKFQQEHSIDESNRLKNEDSQYVSTEVESKQINHERKDKDHSSESTTTKESDHNHAHTTPITHNDHSTIGHERHGITLPAHENSIKAHREEASSTDKAAAVPQYKEKELLLSDKSPKEADEQSERKISNKATPIIQILNITTSVNKVGSPSKALQKPAAAPAKQSGRGIVSRISGSFRQYWQNLIMRWQNWIVNLLTIRKRK